MEGEGEVAAGDGVAIAAELVFEVVLQAAPTPTTSANRAKIIA